MGVSMSGKTRGELILFPKTIDYYQFELTKLLEKEAYGEAIRMLEFLVDCRPDDDRASAEWSTLLQWLRTEFPGAARAADEPEELGPAGEEELLRAHVSAKTSKDKLYTKRLLESLSRASLDSQLLALEQLAYVTDDGVAEALKEKLADPQLHPFVGFKLLQTLAKLGFEGEATFGKLGEIVTVDVERTPPSAERFPEPLPQIVDRVRAAAEDEDPTVAEFAKRTWEEFLPYWYGTALYRELLRADEAAQDVWASALHAAVSRAMYGDAPAEELQDRYSITESLLPDWEKAYGAIARFFRDVSGVHV